MFPCCSIFYCNLIVNYLKILIFFYEHKITKVYPIEKKALIIITLSWLKDNLIRWIE